MMIRPQTICSIFLVLHVVGGIAEAMSPPSAYVFVQAIKARREVQRERERTVSPPPIVTSEAEDASTVSALSDPDETSATRDESSTTVMQQQFSETVDTASADTTEDDRSAQEKQHDGDLEAHQVVEEGQQSQEDTAEESRITWASFEEFMEKSGLSGNFS